MPGPVHQAFNVDVNELVAFNKHLKHLTAASKLELGTTLAYGRTTPFLQKTKKRTETCRSIAKEYHADIGELITANFHRLSANIEGFAEASSLGDVQLPVGTKIVFGELNELKSMGVDVRLCGPMEAYNWALIFGGLRLEASIWAPTCGGFRDLHGGRYTWGLQLVAYMLGASIGALTFGA